MFPHGFKHKCLYLVKHADKSLLEGTTNRIDHIFQDEKWQHHYCCALVRTLKLDLCYCITKHLNWLKTKIFPDILIEFLASDYKFPHALCEEIVFSCLEEIKKCEMPTTHGESEDVSDKDFLFHVFVASVTAIDEDSLVFELGLGTGLLRRIRKAAESVLKDSLPDQQRVVFLPHIDAILSEIMHEVALKVARVPWIMDQYKLKFILGAFSFSEDENENENEKASDALVEGIFQLLLRVGKHKLASFSQIENWYTELFCTPATEIGSDEIQSNTERLIQFLTNKELLYLEKDSKHMATTIWGLTQKSQELTSDSYAYDFYQKKPFELAKIFDGNQFYQMATIKKMPPECIDELLEILIENKHKFTPKSFKYLITFLFSNNADHKKILDFLTEIFTNKGSPWLQIALCEIIPSLEHDSALKSLLDKVIQERSCFSKKVWQTAQAAINRLDSI